MTCIPKHIACGWYSPEDGSPPGFVAGPESCVLSSFTESRGRLTAGGTFFRSISFGPATDNIQISTKWVVNSGSPVEYYNSGTHALSDVERVELVITESTNSPVYYYAPQTYVTPTGSPLVGGWTISAIGELRNQLSLVVNMPNKDVPAGWDNTGSPVDDADHLGEFDENLTGGSYGNPILVDIRTGPALSMIFIDTSEDIGTGATIEGNFGIRYWNGACWKLDDLINPDCTEFVGSPLLPVCPASPADDCT